MGKSVESEINNVVKRDSWGKVTRGKAESEDGKIIQSKWVFVIKYELNNTVRYKTRLYVNSFHQAQGLDCTESFSPVANMSTIGILLLTTLHIEDHGWICEIFNVEAAFQNTKLETPMRLEQPESMRELRFITEEEERDKRMMLVRPMYGNVDTALRWQKILIKLRKNNKIKCIQSKTDPCMLHKKNDKEKTCLMISVYVDDELMARESENIKIFKQQFRKTYEITNLGKLKRLLGIQYVTYTAVGSAKYGQVIAK